MEYLVPFFSFDVVHVDFVCIIEWLKSQKTSKKILSWLEINGQKALKQGEKLSKCLITGMDYWTDIFLVFKYIAIVVVLIESFWL